MDILALDTSQGACSAAILRAEGPSVRLFARTLRMARGHAEALMPMVAEVVAEAGMDFAALDLVAATLGPGSFTGVRIAIAAARALALATGAKLWGTDSLTVMARGALDSGGIEACGRPFAVAVDARRSMLYLGLFDAKGRRLMAALSRRNFPICSLPQPRSPPLPMKRARRSRRCVRSISAPPTPSRNWPWD